MLTIEQLRTPVVLPEEHGRLACLFLLVFSRFEAALKQAGYVRPTGDRLVVEWRRFAQENQPAAGDHPALITSIRPLIERPPWRQRVVDGRLDFVCEPPRMERVDSEWLLEMVYRVRNNLFHGGKWPVQPERDPELLSACLAALGHYVDLNTNVARAYFEM